MVKNGLHISEWGNKAWFKDDKYHRLNNYSRFIFGEIHYHQNDLFHRLDGPAVIYDNGAKFWYYHGDRIICSSQAEFERIIKLKILW